MNPSNWFRAGGALIDPQRLGCLPIIARWAVWFGILAMICGLYSCAHAQQGSWNIPRSAYSTVRTPDPPIKLCPEERITTIVQARAADKAVCK